MARAAIPGRLTWRVATVAEIRDETATARTLALDIPGWPGHLPGQHLNVRLTAPDGYQAQRDYSIGSAWPAPSPDPASGPDFGSGSGSGSGFVELTVQRVDDGEVSDYLTTGVAPGDQLELRGPIGGWFVWRPASTAPVLLVAGGSGMVPLMSMIRARRRQPFRLIYSARTPEDVLYRTELARQKPGLDIHYVYTRVPPARRISVATLNTHGWPPDFEPDCFVCGPTGFVEAAADMLVALGHDPRRVKTERFG
ncbi:ferredoxin reductase [Actinoplanes sp. NPDC049265]|uniref:ferredoxin reductase n=1 Tax=Actinoplanes sp. NPDC049265 TaxID=3363902 RepID=UPI003718EA6A